MPVDNRYELLKERLKPYAFVVVCFSGGVDSSLLLAAARDALDGNVLALTWQSEVTSDADIKIATVITASLGVSHQIIGSSFLENNEAAANPLDRCYHCRKRMYQEILKVAGNIKGSVVLEGTNADDLKDFRPGLQAAEEAGIKHPLAELGLAKADIREMARQIGLPNWDKEASPCLATRFSHGLRISSDRLRLVEEAEMFLRELGFSKVRVRLLDDTHARIEVDEAEVPAAREKYPEINAYLSSLGLARSEIDPNGYRAGSLYKGEV